MAENLVVNPGIDSSVGGLGGRAFGSCSPAFPSPREFGLDLFHDLDDPPFLRQDVVDQLSGGRCSNASAVFGFLMSRLHETRSPASSYLITSLADTRHAWSFSFRRFLEPFDAIGELLELDRLRLRVVLAAFGQRLLVVPDRLGRSGPVEEQQVRRDGCVRGEDAVGQPDDRVQVELREQLVLDPGADAIAEQRAVGHDDRGPAAALIPRAGPSAASA